MSGRLALLVAAITAGAACGGDFDPYSRVTALRVLAIGAEPAAPTTGESTTLVALVYTPPDTSVTAWTWSWCPFAGPASEGYPCEVTEEDLARLGGSVATVPPFDLGRGETATLANSIDPALLGAICRGTPDQPAVVDCTGGFPVQIKLVIEAGKARITAVRELRLRFAPEQDANANPSVAGLAALTPSGEVAILETPEATLARGEEIEVRAEVPAEASETFTGVDEDTSTPTPERERLILSWFVECGDLHDERTTFIEGIVPLEEAVKNRWRPALADDYPRETADLYLVLRDSRGGVGWRRGSVTLGPPP